MPVYVSVEDDRVAHIEFRYFETEHGGLLEDDASDLVESALPADADLVEEYFLPATPEGPVPLLARRWESDDLGNGTVGGRESILVVCQQAAAPSGPGIVILAVSLTLSTAP